MRSLEIGLVFETFETYPRAETDPVDFAVEFEPESTVLALESAIASLGHRSRRLGSPHALLDAVATGSGSAPLGVDAAFNLAEGMGTRNREAWAPVLLEMAGVPTLGSDALSLSMTLDKAWTNRWLQSFGLPVPSRVVLSSGDEAMKADLPTDFPLFVKPRWEGTAKGIRETSRVMSREALAREVDRIAVDYRQPALVEAFLPGAEYTVTLIGNEPPHAFPVVQRALERRTGIGLHALEGPGAGPGTLEHVTPGSIDRALEDRLADLAIRAFQALECRDFARVDFRLDEAAEPVFLEINPLPTFATDGTFAILAELEGTSLDVMLGRCVTAGLERLGLA